MEVLCVGEGVVREAVRALKRYVSGYFGFCVYTYKGDGAVTDFGGGGGA